MSAKGLSDMKFIMDFCDFCGCLFGHCGEGYLLRDTILQVVVYGKPV